mmetsp:Transcript_11222/g.26786  ORF Transcript_11222/g.26786 Transcript_11222/m.26786 type:complete len:245 (-) Transcript_11222:85-819(-)
MIPHDARLDMSGPHVEEQHVRVAPGTDDVLGGGHGLGLAVLPDLRLRGRGRLLLDVHSTLDGCGSCFVDQRDLVCPHANLDCVNDCLTLSLSGKSGNSHHHVTQLLRPNEGLRNPPHEREHVGSHLFDRHHLVIEVEMHCAALLIQRQLVREVVLGQPGVRLLAGEISPQQAGVEPDHLLGGLSLLRHCIIAKPTHRLEKGYGGGRLTCGVTVVYDLKGLAGGNCCNLEELPPQIHPDEETICS